MHSENVLRGSMQSRATMVSMRFPFDNTYALLPDHFHARVNPVPVAAPRLIKLNERLAEMLGLETDGLTEAEMAAIFSGNRITEGSQPLSQAYAGHQFGHFVPQLGDGRANLLGEVVGRDGQRYDIQLKGSGPTPFSRRGDGRAAIGPVLREYVVSEAMAALGVPTTRALAAVTTGEGVARECMQPGAILTRVAASHLRVGTFQYFAARSDVDGLRTLADYAIARHYPQATDTSQPYRALLDGVIARQANLVAQWMNLGFIHGVMNTDNTSISGETIDYGPCAFMEAYEPDKVFSSIDQNGRYAYSNQPQAMHWNLTRLAEALLPLLAPSGRDEQAAMDSAYEALAAFAPLYEGARSAGLRRKLGFFSQREQDASLAEDLLQQMAASDADFTLTFRLLSNAAGIDEDAALRQIFVDKRAFDLWLVRWRQRLADEPASQTRADDMRRANPIFLPRNHLVQSLITAAEGELNFQPFEDLLNITAEPFLDKAGQERFSRPAGPQELIAKTFCGT